MEQYKFIDKITSDVMFEAYGKTLAELFENSALAMFSVICDISQISTDRFIEVEVKGDSLEDLMVSWLQELIAFVDIHEMFFSRFEVEHADEKTIRAKIYGEPVTPEKAGVLVKGVTYYKLKVENEKGIYKATVSLDI